MKRIVCSLLLAAVCAAEVVEYRGSEAIVVPVPVSTSSNGVDAIRSVVLLGVTRVTIKGTWSTDQLQVIQNGNILRIALLQNPPAGRIPVTAVGDNGVLYHIEVRPAGPGAQLDPIVNVVAIPGAGNAGANVVGGSAPGRSAPDRQQVNGGSFEHITNLVLRLHKHIRGGRAIPEVRPIALYNEEAMAKEKKRVPGKVWTVSDDWRVLGYYEWTLGNVVATYVGVTYTGREPERDFEYLAHQTDTMRYIWHQRRADEPQVYDRKWPVIRLTQGVEEFFLIYEER